METGIDHERNKKGKKRGGEMTSRKECKKHNITKSLKITTQKANNKNI